MLKVAAKEDGSVPGTAWMRCVGTRNRRSGVQKSGCERDRKLGVPKP